ncbi:MAG: serine hydrolase [Mollicutes bacterium]|nr:serine hydrolase [Mollicutes bacterium]
MKKRNRPLILFLIFLIGGGTYYFQGVIRRHHLEQAIIITEKNKAEAKRKEEEARKQKAFNECLASEFSEEMETEEINSLTEKIRVYGEEHNLSYHYQNLNNNYLIKLNTTKSYYAASLYKLLDLIYLVELSNQGEIDLNHNLIYKKNHKKNNSLGMEKHQLNSEISIKDLIRYVGNYSDNTAHAMLVDYIKLTNLRTLGKEMSAVNLMDDNGYGISNIKEITSYMLRINELINLNNENSNLLKEAMNSDYYNALNIEETKFYHKYGMWDVYYHDAGISIGNNPYLLVIMSQLRNKDYENVFREMSQKIYEFNTELINTQKNFCQELVYGG